MLLDRSGFYAATSSSDKSLALYDFDIGECVAGMVGHSGEFFQEKSFSNRFMPVFLFSHIVAKRTGKHGNVRLWATWRGTEIMTMEC